MEIGQILLSDSGISANWVMAGLLTILLIVMKRSADAAERREKKIDDMLEKQQLQLNNHELLLARHGERLDGLDDDIGNKNMKIYNQIMSKIGALDMSKKSKYDKE